MSTSTTVTVRNRTRGRGRRVERLLFGLLLGVVGLAAQARSGPDPDALSNRLAGHASPYLAMHGEDPVAWQTWSPEAFAYAREHDRLILVSVGYFACHWCHVMQRESYRDADIAGAFNGGFVAIKVDRERLPGVDARLMDFAERTRGRGGWPLNVFLTPEGMPLLAVLYEPPQQFLGILGRLLVRWRQDPEALRDLAAGAQRALSESVDPGRLADVTPTQWRLRLRGEGMASADLIAGGFGDQAKFPSAPQLVALLRVFERHPDAALREFLVTTLDQMAHLGLRDHVRGGFFRYTVDPGWHTPHFEKMLYDNAQLPALYLDAARVLGRDDYAAVGFDTLDFVQRTLAMPRGGFASSLSAVDAEGEEGGAYLWTREDLATRLDERAFAVLERAWDMPDSATEPFLPRLRGAAPDSAAYRAAIARLAESRAARTPPRDTKVIAAWNGLLLSALVRAAQTPGGARFAPRADALAGFVREAFTAVPDTDALRRLAGERAVAATLEDYVLLAAGLTDWAVWRGDEAGLERAAAWLRRAWAAFHDVEGWLADGDALLRYGVAQPLMFDGPLPSPSAIWLRTADRLGGRAGLRDLAAERDAAVRAGQRSAYENPFWAASHITLWAD